MTDPYAPGGHGQPPSRVRKAFYGFSQHQSLIAQIMFDTPVLKRAYYALLGVGSITVSLAILTAITSYVLNAAPFVTGVMIALTGVLVYLFPLKVSFLSAGAGVILGAVSALQQAPLLELPVLYGVLALTTCVTALIAAFLTRHAVSIASQVWEHMIEQELEPTDETVEHNPAD